MKATLSAVHLLRHFALFALTVIFLLTMTRATFSLWQFPRVLDANVLDHMFVTGLRFDLALVGGLLLVPVIIGPLLGMFDLTRGLARYFVVGWLILALLFVLITELITPYFLAEQGIRPDVPAFQSVEQPLEALAGLWSTQLIPAVVGTLLSVLILFAFCARLEISRMLRFRLSRPSALVMMVLGSALCLFAMWSSIDPNRGPLSPNDSLVSADATVNDITLNSGFKTAFSAVLPMINARQASNATQ